MENIKFLLGDASQLDLPDKSVDLIVTHPPYFGIDVKRYGGEPNKQINATKDSKKMLKQLVKCTLEMQRVLKRSGNLFIAIGPEDDMPYRYITEIRKKTKLQLVDTVTQNSYSEEWKRSERIVGNQSTVWFHLILNGMETYYNPYQTKKYNNPVWDLPFNNISDPVDKELKKRGYHIVDVMNKEIPRRFIEMFSKPNHVVLDPFGGSGLVAVTAVELGRIGITNDISEKQDKSAKDRAKLTLENNG